MSAFVCPPEHFGLLAAFIARTGGLVIPEWRAHDAPTIAELLARECIRSVATRYPDDVSGNRPGPALTDQLICAQARAWAATYLNEWPAGVSLALVRNFASCYDYQSCETSDYETTPAHQQIEAIWRATPDTRVEGWVWTDPSLKE